jgi:hypothetical protein
MRNTIIRFGLYSGALAAVLMVATSFYYSKNPDFENGANVGNAGILLSMLFVFFGVRSYREQNGGILSFAKGLQARLSIVLISCVCYALTWMVVYETILPDFMDQYAAQMITKLRNSGVSEDMVQAQIQEIQQFKEMYANPLIRFGFSLLEPFRIGLFVALASAFLLKRKESIAEQD